MHAVARLSGFGVWGCSPRFRVDYWALGLSPIPKAARPNRVRIELPELLVWGVMV